MSEGDKGLVIGVVLSIALSGMAFIGYQTLEFWNDYTKLQERVQQLEDWDATRKTLEDLRDSEHDTNHNEQQREIDRLEEEIHSLRLKGIFVR